jgi:hypothetical protein
LRRVATLVARDAPPGEVFAAVTEEVGRLLGVHFSGMGRFDSGDTVTVLGTWAAEGEEHPLVPGPWPLEGGDLVPLENKIRQVTCRPSVRQAACAYSVIKPPEPGNSVAAQR